MDQDVIINPREGLERVKSGSSLDTETKLRLAEEMIQQAKKLLWDEWNDYADVQMWMHDMEMARMKTSILLSSYLHGQWK